MTEKNPSVPATQITSGIRHQQKICIDEDQQVVVHAKKGKTRQEDRVLPPSAPRGWGGMFSLTPRTSSNRLIEARKPKTFHAPAASSMGVIQRCFYIIWSCVMPVPSVSSMASPPLAFMYLT